MGLVHLFAYALDEACSCLLATKAKGKTERECECDNQTGEEWLDKVVRDLQVVECGEDREDPDRPARERTEEVGRADIRCRGGSRTSGSLLTTSATEVMSLMMRLAMK